MGYYIGDTWHTLNAKSSTASSTKQSSPIKLLGASSRLTIVLRGAKDNCADQCWANAPFLVEYEILAKLPEFYHFFEHFWYHKRKYTHISRN